MFFFVQWWQQVGHHRHDDRSPLAKEWVYLLTIWLQQRLIVLDPLERRLVRFLNIEKELFNLYWQPSKTRITNDGWVVKTLAQKKLYEHSADNISWLYRSMYNSRDIKPYFIRFCQCILCLFHTYKSILLFIIRYYNCTNNSWWSQCLWSSHQCSKKCFISIFLEIHICSFVYCPWTYIKSPPCMLHRWKW